MHPKVSTEEMREEMRNLHARDVAHRFAGIDASIEAERERVAALIRGDAPHIVLPDFVPPTLPENASKRERKEHKRVVKNAIETHRRVVAKIINDADLAEQDARLAPAVRRREVADADGNVLRPARIERDGATYRRSNPVKRLAEKMPTFITERHIDASKLFLSACEEVGTGIGLGATDWASKVSGGAPGSGVSEAKQSAILKQCRMRAELEGALMWMGASARVVTDVIWMGMTIPAWAKVNGLQHQVAEGIFVSGLDRLADFYLPKSPRAERLRVTFFATSSDDQDDAEMTIF